MVLEVLEKGLVVEKEQNVAFPQNILMNPLCQQELDPVELLLLLRRPQAIFRFNWLNQCHDPLPGHVTGTVTTLPVTLSLTDP